MKKILAVFFTVALAAMLFSCGGKNNGGSGTNGAVGDVITSMSDMIDDLMPGTDATRNTTKITSDTHTMPDGTEEALPRSAGGGTTVQ